MATTPAHPTGSRSSSAGFTLIELVIVIAILGILAAVALPQYTEIKRESELAKELTELRCVQLALAERPGYPSSIADTNELLTLVNEGGICRLRVTPPKVEFDFYWCIRYLPDGSPYITQCLGDFWLGDYMLGVRVPELIDPVTNLPQLVTISSFDGVQAREAPPILNTLPATVP